MVANPKVGQFVTWIGQEDVRFCGRIERITEPQRRNFVLWIGKDDFPINYRDADPIEVFE